MVHIFQHNLLCHSQRIDLQCRQQILKKQISYRGTIIQTSNNQHTLLIIQNEVAPECTVLFFNYMIENHYDVFGLIEQGLAIDFNTLEK